MKKGDREKLLEKISYTLNFNRHGPYFDWVTSFFVACVGLNPTLDKIAPKDKAYNKMRQKDPEVFLPPHIILDGKAIPGLTVTPFKQLKNHEKLKRVDFDICLISFCSMLIITAYESHKNIYCKCPIIEFFRHVRNACAHDNKFFFKKREPVRPAKWRSLKIDHTKKGENNPLFGNKCFSGYLGPSDSVILLNDIENHIREAQARLKEEAGVKS